MKLTIQTLNQPDIFQLCNQKGSDCSRINSQKIKLMGEYGPRLTQDIILKMLEAHHDFLSAGGAGGKWKTLQVGDVVIGFYEWEEIKEGEQAIFERMNLTKGTIKNLEFPFANFCSVYAIDVDFSLSNLGFSLFTDATLINANFKNANLNKVDFSRSDLSGADFTNANLSNVDFENCKLSRANFTGAKFDSAQFPGAQLDGVIY